jgi:hypothetical protein
MVDQPRRGRAGQTAEGATIAPAPAEPSFWQIFRLGIYPDFFPGTAFPTTPDALDEYWRQVTPNTGPEPAPTGAGPHPQIDGVAALFDEIAPSVLVTHSLSGRYGWITRIKSDAVRGIVSYEPSQFTYPTDAPPGPLPGTTNPTVDFLTSPIPVSPADFAKLTEIPIQIVFGDNVPRDPNTPSPYPGIDLWRAAAFRAQQFVDLVNQRGGDATVLHLPDAGLTGNTHFPFSDLNNLEVADLMSEFLRQKRLHRR